MANACNCEAYIFDEEPVWIKDIHGLSNSFEYVKMLSDKINQLTPKAVSYTHLDVYKRQGYDDPMWGARMIHSILTNPTYTGDLALSLIHILFNFIF